MFITWEQVIRLNGQYLPAKAGKVRSKMNTFYIRLLDPLMVVRIIELTKLVSSNGQQISEL